ncbi:MAG: hypothetical protein KAS32_16440 [Candidatus Peribacteraceae bacterium]|nr:hypothetical protein [Candidatus Peribacteraceae bacterium]
MDKKFKTKTMFPSLSRYPFIVVFILLQLIMIYCLFWDLKIIMQDFGWYISYSLISFILIYFFSRYPKWVEISKSSFMPFVPQNLLEFITRTFQWLEYDEIFHVKIYRIDGNTFRMDLKLKEENNLIMHFLEHNPELAKTYEEVFRMKLDENAFTVIEKYSEINE